MRAEPLCEGGREVELLRPGRGAGPDEAVNWRTSPSGASGKQSGKQKECGKGTALLMGKFCSHLGRRP